MAASEPAFRTSVLPIFNARLHALMAIAPALRELPRRRVDELQSLLKRAEILIEESIARPTPSESEFPAEP